MRLNRFCFCSGDPAQNQEPEDISSLLRFSRVAYLQQYLFLLSTLLSLCAAQYSIHLLILSYILSFVYILMSIAIAAPPRGCASFHPWIRLHERDSPCISRGHCGDEISLALVHAACSSYPTYSVTALAIWYIGDRSYLLSCAMVLSRPSV